MEITNTGKLSGFPERAPHDASSLYSYGLWECPLLHTLASTWHPFTFYICHFDTLDICWYFLPFFPFIWMIYFWLLSTFPFFVFLIYTHTYTCIHTYEYVSPWHVHLLCYCIILCREVFKFCVMMIFFLCIFLWLLESLFLKSSFGSIFLHLTLKSMYLEYKIQGPSNHPQIYSSLFHRAVFSIIVAP